MYFFLSGGSCFIQAIVAWSKNVFNFKVVMFTVDVGRLLKWFLCYLEYYLLLLNIELPTRDQNLNLQKNEIINLNSGIDGLNRLYNFCKKKEERKMYFPFKTNKNTQTYIFIPQRRATIETPLYSSLLESFQGQIYEIFYVVLCRRECQQSSLFRDSL